MTVLSTIWLHSLLIKSFLGDIKYFWPIFNNYWWLTTANIPSFTRYKRCIADKQSNRAGLVHKFVTSPSIQTAPNAIHFYLLCCSNIKLVLPKSAITGHLCRRLDCSVIFCSVPLPPAAVLWPAAWSWCCPNSAVRACGWRRAWIADEPGWPAG